MTQLELIEKLAIITGIEKANITRLINQFQAEIVRELKKGGKVYTGLGIYEVKHRQARNGTNPKTHAIILIPASNTTRFTPKQALRDALN